MPKRQGRDDFGLNLETRKADRVEIQTSFYVVSLIKTAVNGIIFEDFAIRHDNNLPRYSCVELRSTSAELRLRYSSVVVLVEFRNLRGVLDRQRQCCLQAVWELAYR